MERGNSISLLDCSPRGRASFVRGICDLPDSVLSHILSFLPTKNAVATTILSQRLEFLWTMTFNLNFRFNGYNGVDRFVEFVNYVLRLHNPGFLNGFTLLWRVGCMPFCVNAWINTAIARNVRMLNLYVEISEFTIPVQTSIFSCESLQSLKLNVYKPFCISQEIAFSLPKLETLKLDLVIFESEETLCKLLGGCPLLEDVCLTIEMAETRGRCHLDDGIPFRCIISSTSLRHLVLFAEHEDRCTDYMSICVVQLDAPSLEYIELQDIYSISVRQTPISLVEANIRLALPDFEEQDRYNCVVEAICGFDCAKKLVLNCRVIEAFKRAPIEMKTVFNQLTKLEVTKDLVYWIDLHRFLQWVGNLEVFIVHQDGGVYHVWGTNSDEEEHTNRIATIPNLVPRCLSNSLKFVLIDGYAISDDKGEDDFRMISYILKYASVLQLMEISRYYGNKREVIQKISELPRKSLVCEVEFPRYGPNRISRS